MMQKRDIEIETLGGVACLKNFYRKKWSTIS